MSPNFVSANAHIIPTIKTIMPLAFVFNALCSSADGVSSCAFGADRFLAIIAHDLGWTWILLHPPSWSRVTSCCDWLLGVVWLLRHKSAFESASSSTGPLMRRELLRKMAFSTHLNMASLFHCLLSRATSIDYYLFMWDYFKSRLPKAIQFLHTHIPITDQPAFSFSILFTILEVQAFSLWRTLIVGSIRQTLPDGMGWLLSMKTILTNVCQPSLLRCSSGRANLKCPQHLTTCISLLTQNRPWGHSIR